MDHITVDHSALDATLRDQSQQNRMMHLYEQQLPRGESPPATVDFQSAFNECSTQVASAIASHIGFWGSTIQEFQRFNDDTQLIDGNAAEALGGRCS